MQIHERSTRDCLQSHLSYPIKFIEMICSKLDVHLLYTNTRVSIVLFFNVVIQDVLFLLLPIHDYKFLIQRVSILSIKLVLIE